MPEQSHGNALLNFARSLPEELDVGMDPERALDSFLKQFGPESFSDPCKRRQILLSLDERVLAIARQRGLLEE